MLLTVLSSALFLPLQGVSTFAAPEDGQAVLAGLEEITELPPIFADTVGGLTGLVFILLGFVGHILIGVAVWRSGTLPRRVVSGGWMFWSVLSRPPSARAMEAPAARPRVR